jgi:hypothetical protein
VMLSISSKVPRKRWALELLSPSRTWKSMLWGVVSVAVGVLLARLVTVVSGPLHDAKTPSRRSRAGSTEWSRFMETSLVEPVALILFVYGLILSSSRTRSSFLYIPARSVLAGFSEFCSRL